MQWVGNDKEAYGWVGWVDLDGRPWMGLAKMEIHDLGFVDMTSCNWWSVKEGIRLESWQHG
ncbi:hypothetical protein ACLOJK_018346, partial [Asimina triloba]